jgi:hypothetical protein
MTTSRILLALLLAIVVAMIFLSRDSASEKLQRQIYDDHMLNGPPTNDFQPLGHPQAFFDREHIVLVHMHSIGASDIPPSYRPGRPDDSAEWGTIAGCLAAERCRFGYPRLSRLWREKAT